MRGPTHMYKDVCHRSANKREVSSRRPRLREQGTQLSDDLPKTMPWCVQGRQSAHTLPVARLVQGKLVGARQAYQSKSVAALDTSWTYLTAAA